MLWLLGLTREHNQSLLVGLQALHIKSLALLAEVPPSVIHNDTNTLRLLPPNTSLLELSQSETTSLADLPVVLDSLATHSGTKKGEGANAECGDFSFPCLTTAELATGLVEPGADTDLPVLAEMISREN